MTRPDYAMPFADLFRELTPAEKMELTESVRANGVMTAVSVYTSPKHGPSLIDGANRWAISGELGVPCPVNDLGEMNDAQARDLAEQLNHCRRHLSPQDWRDMAAKRAERIKRVAEKRQGGKSIRDIAGEEGVDSKTIQKDLKKASGVDGSTPEAFEVKGKDGKTYPATKPKPKPNATKEKRPKPVIQPESEPDDESEQLSDAGLTNPSGNPVRPEESEDTVIGDEPDLPAPGEYDPFLATAPTHEPKGAPSLPGLDEYGARMHHFAKEKIAWRPRWDKALRTMRQLVEELDLLATGPSGAHLRNIADRDGEREWKPVVVQRGNTRLTITMYGPILRAIEMLEKARPDRICAACNGRECPHCRQSGIIPHGDCYAPPAAAPTLFQSVEVMPWEEE